jgi:hypothetical protein
VDRFRRSFLRKGRSPENVRGGHCLINWQTCLRLRKWGGLGIKDIEKFSRAIRMCWLWHQWDLKERPWKHILKITDPSTNIYSFALPQYKLAMARVLPSRKQGGYREVHQKSLLLAFIS